MTIWLLALVLTAIACATLYYAGAGRTVNAGVSTADATTAHFRAQLQAIEQDAAAGRMGAAEVTAAKGELAREVMRLKSEPETIRAPGGSMAALIVSIGLIAVLSVGAYWYLGRPDLPGAPLAGRTAELGKGVELDKAIATIEARLKEHPEDARGWQVIAPAYIQLGRYTDAVTALRRVNDLTTPTAESLSDLGEAIIMSNGGKIGDEPMALFRKAAALDPKYVRALFYIASGETELGQYDDAIRDWNALLAMGKGDEPWMITAREGLSFAEQIKNNPNVSLDMSKVGKTADEINAMVDRLDARLKAEGGTIEDWTQLVRSRIVQGRKADAQAAYDAAIQVYRNVTDRGALDSVAQSGGLEIRYHP